MMSSIAVLTDPVGYLSSRLARVARGAGRVGMALQIRMVRARGGLEDCQLLAVAGAANAADLRMPAGVPMEQP